MSYNLFWLYY